MRKTIFVPELSAPSGVFAHATEVAGRGRTIYVSGMTSRNPDGSVHGVGDVEAQTHRCLQNLQAILRTSAATLDDIVRVTVFMKNRHDFSVIHRVRSEYFKDPAVLPASTMVEVSDFVNPDFLIEFEATAWVSED